MLQINKRHIGKPHAKDNLTLAYEYISLRKFQLAGDYLRQVTDEKRKRVSYFLAHAMLHFHQDEFESAKKWAARGLISHEISEMLLQMFINCCLVLDEYASAETHLEIALNAHPWNSIFHFQQTYLAWKIGDYNLAAKYLSTAKKLNPDAAIGFYLDAIIAVRKLKLASAERHAKQLIEGDLTDSNSYALMGHILRLQNRTNLAGRCFKRAIELYPPANTASAIPVAHDLFDKIDKPLPFRIGGRRGWEVSAKKIAIGGFFGKTVNITPSTQFSLFRSMQRHKNNYIMSINIMMQLKYGAKFRIKQAAIEEGLCKMYETTNRLQTAFYDEGPYPSAEIIRAYLT